MIPDPHVRWVHRNLGVRGTIRASDSIPAGEHLGQHRRGAQLRGADGCFHLAGELFRLERDPQEALVQIQVEPFPVRPHRVAGVAESVSTTIAVHPAKAVDQKVVGTPTPDVFEQGLSEPLKHPVLLASKGASRLYVVWKTMPRGWDRPKLGSWVSAGKSQ